MKGLFFRALLVIGIIIIAFLLRIVGSSNPIVAAITNGSGYPYPYSYPYPYPYPYGYTTPAVNFLLLHQNKQ